MPAQRDHVTLKRKILLSWSSGKDSAWTLHVLRQRDDVEVVGLLTTINTHFQRVAMHGTRHALLKAQADAEHHHRPADRNEVDARQIAYQRVHRPHESADRAGSKNAQPRRTGQVTEEVARHGSHD